MNIKQLEKNLNANVNRNNRFVKVRAPRKCAKCGSIINKSNKCLTINRQYQGRSWLCMNCVRAKYSTHYNITPNSCQTLSKIRQSIILLNETAFDDEGAYMAYSEALDEEISQCLDCGRCDIAQQLL